MIAKKYSLTRRMLQLIVVFILSALISRASFASTLDVGSHTDSGYPQQQYSCYSNM